MESYLVGEDMWDVVGGDKTKPPESNEQNAEAIKKWRSLNGKAEFALKRSNSRGLFEYIIKGKSAKEIWETLNQLYNKKDVNRLQMLKNELANATQGELSISQFFVKIKNLCSEISLLNPDEPISEARLKRHIVRGLKLDTLLLLHLFKDGHSNHLWKSWRTNNGIEFTSNDFFLSVDNLE
ncbi:unnamed protein product [Coffea canephora]|uniref:Retrotransposon gag domain-containing protein n=1 Tax=Coffea canephora TaxID=49390 RepID=A0A068UTH6_COFCA|nr:unnamed protein product [Coffea canephora]